MNAIQNMFAATVGTESSHPGYMVIIRNYKGGELTHGPFATAAIAREVKREYMRCAYTVEIENLETGELI